jgi:exopolysaccharide biosynthesis predicted pyruvyltransferase EpsI
MTLEQSDSADPYVRFLLANSRKRFYVKPYPGNAGDSLILLGTRFLLNQLGLPETFDPRDADVILMPGGNPGLWPGVHVPVWQEVWRRWPDKQFVVGPAGFPETAVWRDAILANGTTVAALFARDPASHRVLQSAKLPTSVRLGLAQDPALHLRASPWLAAHRSAATREIVLLAFRDDHETNLLTHKVARFVPGRWRKRFAHVENRLRKRKKLSKAMDKADRRFPPLVRDITKQSLDICVEMVRQAAEVHTDRLHLMLLATMLGKPVFAYETFYNKLEGVYKHSLEGWADVSFVT